MKQFRIEKLFHLSLMVMILMGVCSCGGKTTPPGASFIMGNLGATEGFGGSFEVLQWPEGPTIVLVNDIEGEHENSGSASTEDPVWRGQGFARAADGRQVTWRAETSDGQAITFFIDGQVYDLSQGTLFLIRTNGGQTQIRQRKLDLAGRCSDYDSCYALLEKNPLISQFSREIMSTR